ncbi:hypothetical protein AAI421_18345 [Rhodococcus aetherivorans]|uniref:hypothetical protein n=1 Tax=Rhodococcus aetherivorans TaxID=191292 RepID=UPI0031DD5FF5
MTPRYCDPYIAPPRNLWQCNTCNAIRSAKCAPACLAGDHYDPRAHRENAAIAGPVEESL